MAVDDCFLCSNRSSGVLQCMENLCNTSVIKVLCFLFFFSLHYSFDHVPLPLLIFSLFLA